MYCFFFFFSSRRRHTRFDCDWSSDVCSSDLRGLAGRGRLAVRERRAPAGPTAARELPDFSRRVSILQRVRRLLENEAPRARILLHFASQLEPPTGSSVAPRRHEACFGVGYARPKPRRNSLPHRAPHRASRGLPTRQARGHHTLHYREPRPDTRARRLRLGTVVDGAARRRHPGRRPRARCRRRRLARRRARQPAVPEPGEPAGRGDVSVSYHGYAPELLITAADDDVAERLAELDRRLNQTRYVRLDDDAFVLAALDEHAEVAQRHRLDALL